MTSEERLVSAWNDINEMILDEDSEMMIEGKEELGDAICAFHNVVGAYLGVEGLGTYPLADPKVFHEAMILFRHHIAFRKTHDEYGIAYENIGKPVSTDQERAEHATLLEKQLKILGWDKE